MRHPSYLAIAIFFVSLFTGSGNLVSARQDQSPQSRKVIADSGELKIVGRKNDANLSCPLKHTDVKAQISGFMTRVTVTQEFENPLSEKIEAIYTFPLSQNAAVDDMTMIVGDHTVRGKILKREDAKNVYEAAKLNGQRAALLDQERPNIFTQSIANILPGEKILITISYVETLNYHDGYYEFVFPTVVGPRYIPGAATGRQGPRLSPDTNHVPDASRITPPPPPPGMRAGHDISIDVNIDAGVPITTLDSRTHDVDVVRQDDHTAHIRLKTQDEIPNRDFILKYNVAGDSVSDALLTHRTSQGGYFSFILQPPARVTAEDVTPRELVFVLDTSGSMMGFPLEKARETMKLALDNLYPGDTFNVITFSGDEHILFPAPVPATKENLEKAQKFLDSREGGGGTEMMKSIKTSMDPSDASDHIRVVCFMTDGYVGNDMEIIGEVQKHTNARVFSFGIGSSVNRFLLDNMAKFGRGEVEYVGLDDDGSAAAKRFYERVRSPLLTDVSIDWNGAPVSDTYPNRIPDLFSAKPVTVTGRYTGAWHGVIRLKGKMSGRDFVREIPVDLPDQQPQNGVISNLWARSRIDDLMSQDMTGAQNGNIRDDLKQTITAIGLEYRLMTQFTSFIAVEEVVTSEGGRPRTIEVPVDIPDGVDRAGIFGSEDAPYAGSGGGSFSRSGSVSRMLKPSVAKRAIVRSPTASGGGGGSYGDKVAEDEKEVREESKAENRPRNSELSTKMSQELIAVFDKAKTRSPLTADEKKFVHDGLASIQVTLTDKSDENLKILKSLGFQIVADPKTSNIIIGHISVSKLEVLGKLKCVLYISPYL